MPRKAPTQPVPARLIIAIGGKRAVIAQLTGAVAALHGDAGTRALPDLP